jgi:hypothetical protein
MGEAVLAHVCRLLFKFRQLLDGTLTIPLQLKVAKERGIDMYVESAGTSDYHVGEEPHEW